MRLQVLHKPCPVIACVITKVQEQIIDRVDVLLDLLTWDKRQVSLCNYQTTKIGRVEGFRVFRVFGV